MNSAFLRNLTDHEFLKQVRPTTDLEQMLVERLEGAEADEGALESAWERVGEAEEAQTAAENKADELELELGKLREYANKLHAALSEADSENELLDCDDAEWLRP